jgi:hypothetical protein
MTSGQRLWVVGAACVFIASVAAHLAALLDLPVPEGVMMLHVASILVLLPGFRRSTPLPPSDVSAFRKALREGTLPKPTVADVFLGLQGYPMPARVVSGVLFFYALGTYLYVSGTAPRDGRVFADPNDTLRLFSGGWMMLAFFGLTHAYAKGGPSDRPDAPPR